MKRINRRTGRPAARWTAIAVAAAVLLAVPVFAQIQFSDVPDDNPHLEDINFVAGERWFVGYRDGTYKPDQKISPSEMARVLTRAFDEGLTRAEFASFMVAGNLWQSHVKTAPSFYRWDPSNARQKTSRVYNNGSNFGFTRIYVVGYNPGGGVVSKDSNNYWIEPGRYLIDATYFHNGWSDRSVISNACRWMRLEYIPDGGLNFDTVAATDAVLAGHFQDRFTSENHIVEILPTDTAFLLNCLGQ